MWAYPPAMSDEQLNQNTVSALDDRRHKVVILERGKHMRKGAFCLDALFQTQHRETAPKQRSSYKWQVQKRRWR